MQRAMRKSTLETLGLGSVLDIFRRGGLPVTAAALVERVFGPPEARGCLVVSGGNGVVGAGKVMQFASRLEPYGVPVVALDFPGGTGLARDYEGLARGFGPARAARIMANVIQLGYDGTSLPPALAALRPRVLIEAIPELLEVKRAHYALVRAAFPDIEIRSVTSGFPARELGVAVAHPAYPHAINKVWEVVEPAPSPLTQLMWALGLVPMRMEDQWSFVLDVLFCGAMQAACRAHDATNMPPWKLDKWVRRLLGPNPFRAHDAIGAKGATFLTWSCLDHLAREYGPLFAPAQVLVEHKDSGQDWYPPNHFRPVIDWPLDPADAAEIEARLLGPVVQMLTLILAEQRAGLPEINAIGELCAQFARGAVALARGLGRDRAVALVERYHALDPAAAASPWHPEALAALDTAEGRQLYVNAEHDGTIGVISLGRESYNWDVDAELNRALDWLRAEGIGRVIVTGDFHLATQMIGADTADFHPALGDKTRGLTLSRAWTATARRLHDEFAVSVGLVNGKRCLGGFLELMSHCHYLVVAEGAELGMPEVTLPVVPGMEGCHWPFRRAEPRHWPELLRLLLEGASVRAADTVGWLTDAVAPLDAAIALAWALARGENALPRRPLATGPLSGLLDRMPPLSPATGPALVAGRAAILDAIGRCGAVTLAEAQELQAELSAGFLASAECRAGKIGAAFAKTAA
ncbi:MAG: hypothetical protein RLZZ501_2305 [Pseudomonadota bacterium]